MSRQRFINRDIEDRGNTPDIVDTTMLARGKKKCDWYECRISAMPPTVFSEAK
ncbi:hypothetical protein [Hyphomicrobium facile]|uniref:hypothetical protein n=1 Tax=Hyphomicrobium facile TaxID=51670 RepID=UPI0015A71564|nr:hypothetical protein [Hyphomicrobium facile]